MKKTVIAFLAVLSTATIAFAHPHQGRLSDKLNLSGEQQAQWQDLERTFHQDNRAFFEQWRATMQEFRAARQANDTAKLDSLKPVMQQNREQMRTLREAQTQKLMAILNEQQKAQFQQLLAERRQHRKR